MVIYKSLHPYVLDESSFSIGRVKLRALVLSVHSQHGEKTPSRPVHYVIQFNANLSSS